MPRWKHLLHGTALAMVSAASLGFVLVMSSIPRVEGFAPAVGLHLPGIIKRDGMGIPELQARSTRDAHFMLGWVHAQDRLWQMELTRRSATGTLSEVIGETGLASDRFMRTLGLADLALQSLPGLDSSSREALDAYSQGVNSWLDLHRNRLPPQFVLLRHQPQPWRPEDSLSIARLMAFRLSNSWQDHIVKARMANRLDAVRLRELWPNAGLDGPVSLSSADFGAVLAQIPDLAVPRLASNVWAVAGQHTASGKPLLANDPHLNFTVPSQWYLAALQAPGLSVRGATLPGLPSVLIGRNPHIAWGLTSAHADVTDVVIHQVRTDGQGYVLPKGFDTFRIRQEIIKIRDRQDMVLTVRDTRHGPVISDLAGVGWADQNQVLVLRSPVFSPEDSSFQATLKLNQAVDWKSFNESLRFLHSPVLNVAYADQSGNIGMVTAGFIPLRKDADTTLPMRGWLGEGEWKGRIPFDRLPRQFNPPGGILVNANNRMVGKSYPFVISASWPPGYRAQRILDQLQGRHDLTLRDMQQIQMDAVSLAALEIRDSLPLDGYENAGQTLAAHMIRQWDGQMDRFRAEPLIFQQWVRELWQLILGDELAEDFAAFSTVRTPVLHDILTRRRHWCDQTGSKDAVSCDQLARQALENALRSLSRLYGPDLRHWRWGDAHQYHYRDPVLEQVPLLDRLFGRSLPTDGDAQTVNAGGFATGSFTHLHGAGARLVFDLSSPEASFGVVAGGQAGNPLARHARTMLDPWQNGKLFSLSAQNEPGGTRLWLLPGY